MTADNNDSLSDAVRKHLGDMYDLGVRDATAAAQKVMDARVAALEQQLGQAVWNYGEAVRKQQSEYERGFVDGMQKQAQSSVDRAVNAIVDATKGRAP